MDDQDILWDRLIKQSEEEMFQEDGVDLMMDTMVRDTDARDINAFIDAIAQSHGCNVDDVIFYCDPVAGDDGNVKIEEVLLKFSIRSLDHGKINDRIVHTMRIKTTQEVQQLARAMLEQGTAPAAPIIPIAPEVAVPIAPVAAPAPIAKPKRKRAPARVVKMK
jgi:hypothetical protein